MERRVQEAASSDFLERVLFPTLEKRLDRAFPVYGFRRDAQGRWIATRRPQGLPQALRTSPRLYGERRGLRGLDPKDAFLPWLWHEAPTKEARHNPATFGQGLERLARAAGIPLPDDVLRDAAFARTQRSLDLLETAWAFLRALAVKHIGGATLDALADLGYSEPALRDGAYPLGLYPGPVSGNYPATQALRERLTDLGYTEKEVEKLGLLKAGLEDRVLLGLRDEFGTLHDLFVATLQGEASGTKHGGLLRSREDNPQAPRLYGLEVALRSKGGHEDLLVVDDPVTALAMHGRAVQRAVGLVGGHGSGKSNRSFDAEAFDEVVGAGVRGLRFVSRGALAALEGLVEDLPEDQRQRLRMRCLGSAETWIDKVAPLGRHVAKVGVQAFEIELRRLAWVDPRSGEAVLDALPELLLDESKDAPMGEDVASSSDCEEHVACHSHGAADEPSNGHGHARTGEGTSARTTALPAQASYLGGEGRDFAARVSVKRGPRLTEKSGDASRHVHATTRWASERAAVTATEGNAQERLAEARGSYRAPTLARADDADVAASDWLVDNPFAGPALLRASPLRFDMWVGGSETFLVRATARHLVDSMLPSLTATLTARSTEVWWCIGAERRSPDAATLPASVRRVVLAPGSGSIARLEHEGGSPSLIVVDTDVDATAVLGALPKVPKLVLELGTFELGTGAAARASYATRIHVQAFERSDLARLFSRAVDDPFLDDHLHRSSREGRRFFYLDLLIEGAAAATRIAMTHGPTGPGSSGLRVGALPYDC